MDLTRQDEKEMAKYRFDEALDVIAKRTKKIVELEQRIAELSELLDKWIRTVEENPDHIKPFLLIFSETAKICKKETCDLGTCANCKRPFLATYPCGCDCICVPCIVGEKTLKEGKDVS